MVGARAPSSDAYASHTCYHAAFGRSGPNSVRISRVPKIGEPWGPTFGIPLRYVVATP